MVKKLIFLQIQNQILQIVMAKMLLLSKSVFKNQEIFIYFYRDLCCTKIKKIDEYELKESILRFENEIVFDECIETSITTGFIKTGIKPEINDIENIEQYDVYNTQEFLDVLNRYKYDLLLMCNICMYTGCYSDFFYGNRCLEETEETYICKKCIDENENEYKKYNLLDSLDIKTINIHIRKLTENYE